MAFVDKHFSFDDLLNQNDHICQPMIMEDLTQKLKSISQVCSDDKLFKLVKPLSNKIGC
jgi:hypothetical protein